MSAVSNSVIPAPNAASISARTAATFSPASRHMPQASGETMIPLLPKARGSFDRRNVVIRGGMAQGRSG
ncbi:hypothetical protein QP166_11210 [Sphingomonas sp. LR60]|uniref:hypothetical protein n=1 Tax=Sphingomonas sp. LR60 TaxID=3050233 RepID=UPI002FE1154B